MSEMTKTGFAASEIEPKEIKSDKKYMSLQDLADVLELDERDAMSLLRTERIVYFKAGNSLQISISSFNEWAERCKQEAEERAAVTRYYTIDDLCDILQLGRNKVAFLIQEKIIPSVKIGKNIRIGISDFLKWQKESQGQEFAVFVPNYAQKENE